MKKIYRYLLILAIFIGGNILVTGVFANVDVTNSLAFTYDCTSEGGVLHTTFDLGGHHFYQRDYKIDKPGVIEIADANHTTTARSSNISINGCNYKPSSCNVSSWSDWVIDSSDTISKSINITTNLPINKIGNALIINGSGSNNEIKITGFNGVYDGRGKDIKLNFLDDKITLEENGFIVEKYTFTNNSYSGIKEYYYEFSSDNKNILLKKRIFKKNGIGSVMSSNNAYDTFSPYKGTNYSSSYDDISLSPNPDAQGPGYITGLNYWDYTQHFYTTTKVNVYPVSVVCSETQYSDGTNYISSDSYAGTLGGIIQPAFSGPIKVNGIPQQTTGITIYASSSARLEGLQYTHVGEIGGVKVGIDGIEFTVKKNAITLGKQKLTIAKKTTIGEFPALDFNNLEDASGKSFALNIANIYGLEIVLYSGTQIIGTYALPITVIPNNDFKISSINISNNNPYANGQDMYSLCGDIVDSFGNTINTTYDINGLVSLSSSENFDIDSVTSGFQGEGLRIFGPTFINSQFCFNLKSLAPGKKDVHFKARIPKHGLSGDMDANGEFLDIFFIKTISFRKPFIGALSITTSPYNLSIGTMLTMRLGVTQKSTLTTYGITQFKDQMRLRDSINHEFQDLRDAANLSNNPTIDYRVDAATDAGVNIIPGVFINDNPIISYTLDGQVVRYRLSATDSASDIIELSLGGTQLNSLKVVGNLQGQGKQTLANQSANFSDISKSDMRTIIRKNAYTLIRGRTSSETVVGGVKYHEGNYILSGEPNYETLIVKNGNLTINDNFNTSGKKFGIIVLRDGATQTTQGNIYIQPNVRYIRAAIYADGGIISNGFPNDTVDNYKDSAARTNILSEQLVIKGTLFTRNTIGGAIKGSAGKYILPGGSLTTDFDQAMMYDLNYMRRNNHGYTIAGINGSKDYNEGNSNNVVIIFDSSFQSSPPKGFK